jgi:prepilin-type processing-associated H-X9-DG protein
MDENLVGYLLKSLDPDTHRQVDAYLRANPEARRRLELLRQALEPLAADADEEAPPPGLCVRTLARIARQQRRRAPRPAALNLPPAPRPSCSQTAGATRGRWRRADVLVAAGLLLTVLGLAFSALPRLWRDSRVYACQNNLRLFHQALADYSDRHSHAFPKIEDQPPRNVAGVFVPILRDAGALPTGVSLTCPGKGSDAASGTQGLELGKLQYAYSLGYLATGALYGLTSDDDDRLPIMADGPDVRDGQVFPGNSLNHEGRGQNILFIDGHVEFSKARALGVDDIYLNQDGLVAAGRGRFDAVLGASWATPLPPDQ